ncbi:MULTISPECIES: disulfide oxidoreductase [unclassified Paenibacillus]|uniref:disulfide oxidoreductase n=1 Tax=unclassified Paenibacillus TaxID=185978 RepID=UPI0009A8C5C5|nr:MULTISPECIES: disulfide oxidoreductase [unclassified Paenibacillus]SLK18420.1 disulfide bond formation protein DsbB [Paenibacillus sp. RU5A]SOC75235.1 disulfide bond formation protein DsbB [Paenibacillus sp. RU26A]SOC77295.1 disulfide bond formation protein DsbB [Paenibacillus sp. RU5M]
MDSASKPERRAKHIDTRLFIAWAVSVIATGGSLYFSEIKGYIPCDLCWFQRIFMYPLTILLGIAYFKDDAGITKYVLPLSFIGGGISLYHVTIQRIYSATGSSVACGQIPCYTDYLNWFGFITIPLLALIAFIIIIVMLWGIGKTSKSSS